MADLAPLREAIRNQLTGLGVEASIRSLLIELQNSNGIASATPDNVLEMLRTRGVVSKLVKQIGPPDVAVDSLLKQQQQEACGPTATAG